MFESICTLPLSSELFSQDLHPTEPVLAVGLSAGHVQVFRLPPYQNEDGGVEEDASSSHGSLVALHGRGQIETQWRTRRHKGSCRTLGFSLDGQALYSAGTDGLIKAANTETGQVEGKILIPAHAKRDDFDCPSLLHVLSPQTLLLGTDSSALHLFDLRDNHGFKSPKAQATYRPHDDYISSLTPLPPSDASTSGFSKQWVSTGGTTVAVTDLRSGVLVRSEDQEEELLSSVYVDGFGKKRTNVGQKVVVGAGNGVLTLWERGVWDDQDERIVLDRGLDGASGESVDCLANVPYDVAGNGKMVAAGMGSGLIACVQLGLNKVVDVFRHDETEAVAHIGFDVGDRMITGGGQIIKVWQEKMGDDEAENGETEETKGAKKRSLSSDEDDEEDESGSEDEKKQRKKKKNRRKGGLKTKQPSGPGMGSYKGLD